MDDRLVLVVPDPMDEVHVDISGSIINTHQEDVVAMGEDALNISASNSNQPTEQANQKNTTETFGAANGTSTPHILTPKTSEVYDEKVTLGGRMFPVENQDDNFIPISIEDGEIQYKKTEKFKMQELETME